MMRTITVTAAVVLFAAAAVLAAMAIDAGRVATPPGVRAQPGPSASADGFDTIPRVHAGAADGAGESGDSAPDEAATDGTAPEATTTVEADPGVPVALTVPAIGVDTSLEQLGTLPDGTLATPVNTDIAGWFAGGPRPGATGPAVIAGHVTWAGDPSVFFRLAEVAPGDRITVTDDDGETSVFEVTRVEQHPKDAFPTVEVYSNTDAPELRLITCGGDVDAGTGHFVDNVIVFAALTSA